MAILVLCQILWRLAALGRVTFLLNHSKWIKHSSVLLIVLNLDHSFNSHAASFGSEWREVALSSCYESRKLPNWFLWRTSVHEFVLRFSFVYSGSFRVIPRLQIELPPKCAKESAVLILVYFTSKGQSSSSGRVLIHTACHRGDIQMTTSRRQSRNLPSSVQVLLVPWIHLCPLKWKLASLYSFHP